MPINQIFKKKIPEKLIVKILNTIGIKNMDDNTDERNTELAIKQTFANIITNDLIQSLITIF